MSVGVNSGLPANNTCTVTRHPSLREEGIRYSRLEQRSIIKYLVAETCKPCEIYRTLCDVYEETCFNKKNLYKWVKHGFDFKSV